MLLFYIILFIQYDSPQLHQLLVSRNSITLHNTNKINSLRDY